MGLVSVNVRLKDTTPATDPVVGAYVRFYDATDVFVVQAVTDVNGLANVLLDGSVVPGTTYRVRAYKPGCEFAGPWEIQVEDPPVTGPHPNDWTMSVNIFEVPNSLYPGMCRVAGFVVDASGTPIEKAFFRFMPIYDGLIPIHYDRLMTDSVDVEADEDGYVQVDLPRGGKFSVEAGCIHQMNRKIIVPDRGGVLLADLLFPIAASVTYSPVAPYVLAVGDILALVPSVVGSDYADWGDGGSFVLYSSDDTSVLTVALAGGQLNLTGVAAGTANLVMARTSDAFRVVPSRALAGTPIVVTVVP